MDTSKAKKRSTEEKKERVTLEHPTLKVENVRVVDGSHGDVIFFTLDINGVKIYNMRVATGRNGDFISFPQTKGKNDAYYNVAYAPLSDDDVKDVLKVIQKEIDNN